MGATLLRTLPAAGATCADPSMHARAAGMGARLPATTAADLGTSPAAASPDPGRGS